LKYIVNEFINLTTKQAVLKILLGFASPLPALAQKRANANAGNDRLSTQPTKHLNSNTISHEICLGL